MVDYLNFDDVMKELDLSEEDLRRMVSEGELRAFRSENKMKFRKEDVQKLKSGRESEPTVVLPAEEEAEAADSGLELELEESAAEAPAAEAEAVELEAAPELELESEEAPTELEPVVEEEALVEAEAPAAEAEELPALEAEAEDSGFGDLTVEEAPAEIPETDATQVEEEAGQEMETASTTAPLAFAEETIAEEEATGKVTEEGEPVGAGAAAPRRAPPPPPKAGFIWTLILLAGFVPAVFLVLIFVDDFRLRAGFAAEPATHVEWLYSLFGEKFWEDGEWKTRMTQETPAGIVGTSADDPEFKKRQDEAQAPIGPKGAKIPIYLRPTHEFGTYKFPDAALPQGEEADKAPEQ
jgi:hypothetical protein